MRTCRYQPFPFRVDDGAKSFQCTCTKKTQIFRARENDFIHCFESIDSENRVANIPSYDLFIRHLEFLIPIPDKTLSGSQVNSEPVSTMICSIETHLSRASMF